jgi:hypothetical protein
MSLDQALLSKETIAWLSSTIGQKGGCAIFAKYYFILHLVGYAFGVFVVLIIAFVVYGIVSYGVTQEDRAASLKSEAEIERYKLWAKDDEPPQP